MKPTIPSAEDIIRANQDGVWRFLVSIGCEADLADDLTQETFLAALAERFEYRGPQETKAWLLRVAKHKFIDALRKRKDVADTDLTDAEALWQEFDSDYDQRVQWLRECMEGRIRKHREPNNRAYAIRLFA